MDNGFSKVCKIIALTELEKGIFECKLHGILMQVSNS